MKTNITSFNGEYKFLSNFCNLKTPIRYDNISYPTLEHFFQAMKSLDSLERLKISKIILPGAAKKYGRTVRLRPDWNNNKILVMRLGLTLKFAANPDLKYLLLTTWDNNLIEGNYWHDNTWGNCMCPKCINIEGQNLLGKLLMEARTLFRLIC